MMPLQVNFDKKGTQILYVPAKVSSDHVVLDSLKTPFLKKLKWIDDKNLYKYLDIVAKRDTIFKVDESLDSKAKQQQKEAMHRVYNPERF